MTNIKINRLNIDNYKKQISSAVSRKFYQETAHIVGLVSPVTQDMAFYYDEFSIQQFELAAWRTSEGDETIRQGLTVYRVVKGGGDQDSLSDIPLLSYVQATIHLDKKSKCAIFCEGEILARAPDHEFEDRKGELERLLETFSDIECSYENNYEASLNWGGSTVECTLNAGRRMPISTFLLRAFNIIEPRKRFYQSIEKIALNELFELKKKGWFAESGYIENDFLSELALGRFQGFIFEERRFSAWYYAEQLFEGCRIIFDGNYSDGLLTARLYGDVGDKPELLRRIRPSIQIEHFGKFYANTSNTEFSARVPWLSGQIRLLFSSVRGGIDDQQLKTAETVFENQQDWNVRAYKYAVDNFLALKNESWRESDEPLLGVEEFEVLLGDFSISFSQHAPYEFSFFFTTDNKLFAGHGVVISGSLNKGFTHNELIG